MTQDTICGTTENPSLIAQAFLTGAVTSFGTLGATAANTKMGECTASLSTRRLDKGRRLANADWDIGVKVEVTVTEVTNKDDLSAALADTTQGTSFVAAVFTAFKAAAQADTTFSASLGGAYDWDAQETAFATAAVVAAPVISGGPPAPSSTSSASSLAVIGAFAAVLAGVLA